VKQKIDLRSDTVTQPTSAMLKAMAQAPLGDDVFGEDPTIKKLEAMLAERSGKESAIFAPSGTQTNLMGLMSHCERGDEYIVGQTAHTYAHEGGGAAVLGSIQPQPLEFEADGTINLDKAAAAIKPQDDHYARTRLLSLENTMNGKVLPLGYLQKVKPFCQQHALASHLDGARVFNAVVKLGVELADITDCFDSVSICLSKGLGAPVGSVLCGTKDFIKKAHRWRKMLGGGMRQAGILAAGGIHALEHHVDRLREDHDNAAFLANSLAQLDEVEVDLASLQTNIFYIKVGKDYQALQAALEKKAIVFPRSLNHYGWARLVTHLDISREDAQRVVKEVKTFFT
jgi:threonine aldolase